MLKKLYGKNSGVDIRLVFLNYFKVNVFLILSHVGPRKKKKTKKFFPRPKMKKKNSYLFFKKKVKGFLTPHKF